MGPNVSSWKELHGSVHTREHGGLEEIRPQVRTWAASADDFGASFDGVRDHVAHALHVLRTNQRPNVGIFVATRPEAKLLRFRHAAAHKLFGDGFLDEQSFHRKTDLPAICVAAPHRGARGHIQIRVAQNQHGVFAAQLQHGGNQIARARFGHVFAGIHAAGEKYFVGASLNQRLADFAAALQHGDQVGGKARVAE